MGCSRGRSSWIRRFRVRSHTTPGLLRAFGTAQLKAKLGRKQGGLASWLRYALSYSTGGSAWDRLPPERRARLQANVDGVFGDFATGDGSHIDPDDIPAIAARLHVTGGYRALLAKNPGLANPNRIFPGRHLVL